jgi:hypothetical protein
MALVLVLELSADTAGAGAAGATAGLLSQRVLVLGLREQRNAR